MGNWAQIDEENRVIQVVVTDNSLPDDGAAFIQDNFSGTWLQASFTGRIRKQMPGIGSSYDPIADEFISPQVAKGWVLDGNNDWVPPFPAPDENYWWDGESLDWVEIPWDLYNGNQE